MEIKKFHIYSADLNSRMGTEPGKQRPVVVIQSDLLNNIHPSTIICPISSKIIKNAEILRVHLNNKMNHLTNPSDILVDQIRAIDNVRFKNYIGRLTKNQINQLINNLQIIIFE